MANAPYPSFLQALGEGSIDLSAGTFKISLLDSGIYTPDVTDGGDDFYDDISAAELTVATLTATWTLRVFDASDFVGTFPDPGGGDTGEYLVIWKDTGVAATSPLLFFFDTLSGLPMTLDGTADSLTFNASGIWKLGA